MMHEFLSNVQHNLFKPILLFFFLGFAVPILRVPFEFPKALYQILTLYLLIAIGWHGGEELAALSGAQLSQALGLMVLGFFTNLAIGFLAYAMLRSFTKVRRIDAATIAGHYGSDSAGTFVTCIGVLATSHIAYAAYMPVMLAVMEIPGCLVALLMVARLRREGIDVDGNAQGEPGFAGKQASEASEGALFNVEVLREVFLNPGLYLLFGGIIVGYVSGLQGRNVTKADDLFFVDLFQGFLCLFLLEMGMTAARRLRDVRSAGWRFVAFGILSPNIFAGIGILTLHAYSSMMHQPFQLGTYVLFSVLCGAASYIAVPAIQRLAIPEASPTLPLAASLGLTFTYNVTLGIPLYIMFSEILIGAFPVVSQVATGVHAVMR